MEVKEWEGRIINADCMDILKKIPDSSIDLILTDPPYEVDQCGGVGKSALGKRAKSLKDNIKFICIEKDPEFWEKSVRRLEDEQRQYELF